MYSPSQKSLACPLHLRATVRARLLLAAADMARPLWMTITETVEALLAATALAETTRATDVDHHLLVTTTTAETLTPAHPHLVPVARLSMTTLRLEAVLTPPTTATAHLLQPVVTTLTHTPMVTVENPESLTAALPAPLLDASVATMRAMTVDLTGDYPLFSYVPIERQALCFCFGEVIAHSY